MWRYKITIEYHGASFCGWQRQSDDIPSVQQAIEDVLFKLFKTKTPTIVAGRTDSGVHALGQVAHFDTDSNLDSYKIMDAMNFYLRRSRISILDVQRVGNDFNARFSAKMRHYEYRILNRRSPATIEAGLYWQIFRKLDIQTIKNNMLFFIGRYNFNSFRSSSCQSKDPVKTISSLTIDTIDDRIIFNISAKSFLHKQVRIIIGTLVKISMGYNIDIRDVIAKEDRRYAGGTAPAHGLYLKQVDY